MAKSTIAVLSSSRNSDDQRRLIVGEMDLTHANILASTLQLMDALIAVVKANLDDEDELERAAFFFTLASLYLEKQGALHRIDIRRKELERTAGYEGLTGREWLGLQRWFRSVVLPDLTRECRKRGIRVIYPGRIGTDGGARYNSARYFLSPDAPTIPPR